MLDPERMTALDNAWTFVRWQQLLLDAGLLFELPTPTPEPLESLAEVQDRLTVLRALEERIGSARVVQMRPTRSSGRRAGTAQRA